jgi:hypothetical protein
MDSIISKITNDKNSSLINDNFRFKVQGKAISNKRASSARNNIKKA